MKENQTALHGISGNFPVAGIGEIMRAVCFPTGKQVYHGPTDKMVQKAAKLISNPSGIRDLLSEGIFISDNAEDVSANSTTHFPWLSRLTRQLQQPGKPSDR